MLERLPPAEVIAEVTASKVDREVTSIPEGLPVFSPVAMRESIVMALGGKTVGLAAHSGSNRKVAWIHLPPAASTAKGGTQQLVHRGFVSVSAFAQKLHSG